MAYDENLAQRVHQLLHRRTGFSQRKMFGGICFMLHGNMCCGVTQHELMLRLGEKNAFKALEMPHTREMDFTGKPLKSMIYVEQSGFEEDDDLKYWVNQAVKFVQSLPPKTEPSA
ncbi:MAG: TfoX/Sxy family protein [Planctomycetota bacterium]